MNIEEYRSYCMKKKGVTESFPFSKLPSTLVFKVLGKMFSATDINSFKSISVKADSTTIDELRTQYSCLDTQPYMSKNHWNNVTLDNSVSDKLIFDWIDISCQLVIKKLTKKQQNELQKI